MARGALALLEARIGRRRGSTIDNRRLRVALPVARVAGRQVSIGFAARSAANPMSTTFLWRVRRSCSFVLPSDCY